jgi:exopolysaccharide production protein ExoZ
MVDSPFGTRFLARMSRAERHRAGDHDALSNIPVAAITKQRANLLVAAKSSAIVRSTLSTLADTSGHPDREYRKMPSRNALHAPTPEHGMNHATDFDAAGKPAVGKLEGLQVARALAALSVAYFHSNILFGGWPGAYSGWPDAIVFAIPGLKEHGYLGVNFFFVISGYVIAMVADKPTFGIPEFVTKRFFRLYPVYWVIVIAVLLLKVFGVMLPASYKLNSILYSMSLLPHAEGSGSLIAATWSLEFEIMFYLLAALIVPVLGLWGLAAVLFGLVYWAYVAPPEIFTFNLVRTLNSDFLAGVLAYLFRKPLSHVPTAILIGAGLYGYYRAVNGTAFAGSVGGLLIVAGLAHAKWRWDVLPLRWLTQLGDASYSLYLLHFVTLWIFVTPFKKIGLPPGWMAEPVRFIYLALSIWLSLNAYQRIEKPMIRLGNRMAERKMLSPAMGQ